MLLLNFLCDLFKRYLWFSYLNYGKPTKYSQTQKKP